MPQERSIAANLAHNVAWTSLLLVVTGPIGAWAGVFAPMMGFSVFAVGLLLSLPALVIGLVARLRAQDAGNRQKALTGAAIGGALLVIGLVSALPGTSVPRINDITTDLEDPPAFDAVAQLGPNQGRDLDYPPEFAAIQRDGYPDLAPLELALPPEQSFARALAVAERFGWTIVASEPDRPIEAFDRSRLFRFTDDIVVRVRETGAGSRIDMRSRSRDGRGDLGVNAARIEAFFEAIAER